MTLEKVGLKLIKLIRSGKAAEMTVSRVTPWLVYSWVDRSRWRAHTSMVSANR